MADDSTDLLMMFMVSKGNIVPGESVTAFDDSIYGMMGDFKTGSFFEVDDFRLGIGVGEGEGEEDSVQPPAPAQNGRGQGLPRSGQSGPHFETGKPGSNKAGRPRSGKFKKFITPDAGDVIGLEFPIEVQPFTFTRRMDRSSPLMFQYCATLQLFEQVSLVKRKFTGNPNYHEAYMRIDFKKVLLTRVDWNDGDEVLEHYEFICRNIEVKYRPQARSGDFETGTVNGEWTPKRQAVTGDSSAM